VAVGGPVGTRDGAARSSGRKTTKYLDALLVLQRPDRDAFFENAAPREILEICEQSYGTDLVNLFLDLRKSTVRRIFETLAVLRKRAIVDIAALYFYNEYLTNPLPLRVVLDSGQSVPNYYAILGVPRDSTDEELKSAFRVLERAHDLETFTADLRHAREERLREIRDAFNHLKLPQRRARTDKILPNVAYLYPRRDQSWFESLQRLLG
jgi:hypothetical protein